MAVVKQAVAKANSVPAPAVLSAMLDLEAAKLPVSNPFCRNQPAASSEEAQLAYGLRHMRYLCWDVRQRATLTRYHANRGDIWAQEISQMRNSMSS